MKDSLKGQWKNGTLLPYLYFTPFNNQGYSRYVFFSFGLILYFAIIFFNVIILLVIFIERTLHQPMYYFIFCLSINSLYGSAGLFPRLLTDLLSDTHTVSRPACFTQIFVIYTYASYEFLILTVMAYDRYAAICKPLQYHSIMTPRVVTILIAVVWIYPMFSIGMGVFLSARLPLCSNEITKLYCSNWSVVRLSCVPTTLNNIVGFLITITTDFIPLGLVLYSYIQILIICHRSSSEFKSKALQTCLPHIVTFINYCIALFCEIAFSRYDPGDFPPVVAVILSLEFLIIPPVLNPLIYGLNFPEIRRKIQQLLNPPKVSMVSDHLH